MKTDLLRQMVRVAVLALALGNAAPSFAVPLMDIHA
jgi:hypothetical protein